MLTLFDAITMIAVKDLAVAKRFYGETLGLAQDGPDNENVAAFRSGNTKVNLYRSDFSGTNKATTAMWAVGEQVDAVVAALQEKGVAFERYDFPGAEHAGNVHVFGDLRVAWFRDPDGNILSVQNS